MSAQRVLVLGGTGMLGHKVWQECRRRFETYATVRRPVPFPGNAIEDVDAFRPETIARALDLARPDAVVNCIGAIKQRPEGRDPRTAIAVNALFPHQLAAECAERGIRLVHVSTDCVFSGGRGRYRETDTPDPVDLYGRTKLLGEPAGEGCVTLRASLIGRELGSAYGLVEWFLAQPGPVQGFTRAIFSGVTTIVMAEVIADLIESHPELDGLWHVAGEAVSKYDLLVMIAEAAGRPVEIEPVEEPALDRSLDGSRFEGATGWSPEPMEAMIARMIEDGALYERPGAELLR